MKSACVLTSLMGATIIAAWSGLPAVAQAQGAPALQNAPAPTVQRVIVLKNVSPSLVAWWIDPAHNQEPVQLTGSNFLDRPAVATPKPPGDAKPQRGAFELPTGVKSVSPIVPQNALLVWGTEAGIDKLRETIAFLDQPLRQVEIEAQFVQIEDQDAKAIGIDFGKEKGEGMAIDIGFVRGNVRETLRRLVEQKKAKILSAPRLTAINNMAAMIGIAKSRPAVVGYKDENGKFQELFDPAAEKGNSRLLLGTSFQFAVTPTINNDDTVTLLMSPKRVLQLSNESTNQTTELRTLGGLATIVNVRDGDTIALKGLNSHFFVPLEEEKKTTPSNVLMLVTARILRRVGDDVQPVALRR